MLTNNNKLKVKVFFQERERLLIYLDKMFFLKAPKTRKMNHDNFLGKKIGGKKIKGSS